MSKINNHGIGINKINLAIDLQELTCEQAAAIQGGAKITLYEDANFQGVSDTIEIGRSGEIINLTDNILAGDIIRSLGNEVSSYRIESGTFSLWSDQDASGRGLVQLGPGEGNLDSGMNDIVSSVSVDFA
ncbi:MAG: beta/gamma crystallin family protein [Pleurocapsa minor HA4230-MV1]|nr:beta/gamma crystallin family protein [Pleurocapsa minor HA4230-MV1]